MYKIFILFSRKQMLRKTFSTLLSFDKQKSFFFPKNHITAGISNGILAIQNRVKYLRANTNHRNEYYTYDALVVLRFNRHKYL